MSEQMNAIEMFNELVQMGYIQPSYTEPSTSMIPSAYVSVPTMTGFFSPPVNLISKEIKNAKLGSRRKRNSK